MGEVYRARDTRLDRVVALKVYPRTSPTIPSGAPASSGTADGQRFLISTAAEIPPITVVLNWAAALTR